MPYIPEEERKAVWNRFHKHHEVLSEGDLAFMIAALCDQYVGTHGLTYSTCSQVEGVLTTAREEFNRRVTSVHEQQKLRENGEVYEVSNAILFQREPF